MTPAAPRASHGLAGTRVLLGVSGGIAAYKSAFLVRRLREAGAEVRCALTRSAEKFVAPLTLEVLSEHAVYRQEWLEPSGFDESGEQLPGGGTELHMVAARWADVLVVAPCTANTLARLALGLAEDFLSTTATAFAGPLFVAPAMHSEMWAKPSVEEHVAELRRRGATILGPAEGPLASGEVGLGRMVEPEEIVAALAEKLRGPLTGRTVLIDAGPTREPIDPVRYLSNRSTGKMGFALAAEAARRGARVVLVAGPVELATPAGVERVDVETAIEMRDAVYRVAPRADLVILAAAVSDFRPRQRAEQKIKKQGLERAGDRTELVVELEQNPDILAGLADVAPQAVRVGFAAETERLEEHARAKLERKRVDYLVANDVSRSDIGFGSDHNEVRVFAASGQTHDLGRRPKSELARDLLDLFTRSLAERSPADSAAPVAGGGGA